MNELRIIGRQTNGTHVLGYILQERISGVIKPASKETTYKLALEKHIENVVAQVYNGKISMKGVNFKVSSLPNYDQNGNLIRNNSENTEQTRKLYLTGRKVDGNTTLGYNVALVVNGKIVRETYLSRQEVMECAQSGMIANARHQKSNGKDILRGVDCNINKLPLIG